MKKKLIKILGIAALIFAVIFAATFVFLLLEGKAIITGQLANALHREVNIGYVGLTLPFNLEVRNLEIAGLTKIDYASVSPSIPGLLSGKVVLNDLKLINPQFVYIKERAANYERGSSDNADTPQSAPDQQSNQQPKTFSPKNKYLRLIIKNLNIKNGRIDFTDRTLPGEGIKITFKDINFHLTNLYIYPKPATASFQLSASIPWLEGQAEGKIEAKGWVDLFKKNMEASVKISNIDGIYLYPYYATWVDLEKTRIQSAKLDFTSDIKSLNNNLSAQCHLELNDIVFRQNPEDQMSKAEKYANIVMNVFKALNQKVVFNFTIKTKMTSPQFNIGYIKTAFEGQLKEGLKYSGISGNPVLNVPVKVAGKTAKTAQDLSKAVYNGTFGLARVIKDTVKLAFSKEAEEGQ